MSDGTKIEWTDATINAVNGCSVLSPGCKLCYAMKQAHRFDARRGLTRMTAGGMVWTGEVRFNETQLLKPLAWKRARRIFWNAHGDLFHESVPDEWIDKVFAVCALTPQHSHQILTKRSVRMRAYMAKLVAGDRFVTDEIARIMAPLGEHGYDTTRLSGAERERLLAANARVHAGPLPNVGLGVSVEDQQRADERIPDLLATPAAVRFISAEPLLGPITLGSFLWRGLPGHTEAQIDHLDWVIVGGESGPGARRCIRTGRGPCAISARRRACRSFSSSGGSGRPDSIASATIPIGAPITRTITSIAGDRLGSTWRAAAAFTVSAFTSCAAWARS